ncbi:MAG: hypothetical protein ACXADW_16645 [Candidatus Hodarchaeales archaeon]|jgi:hypothetical protein
MPDVSRIILGLRLGVMSDNSVEGRIALFDTTVLVDDNDMAGVVADLSGEDFITYSDDDLTVLAEEIGQEVAEQVALSLYDAREQLRAATEEVDTIEMFQNQEPDWEV